MTAARATFGLRDASRRWWIVLMALTAASAYAYRTRALPESTMRFSGSAQGTTYSVVLSAERSSHARSALQHAVDSVLADIDHVMSTYDSTSELMRLNRAPPAVAFPVSASLAAVLHDGATVSGASGGAFDVTVGPLVDAWGFGPRGTPPRAPSDSMLGQLRERVGWRQLHLDGSHVTKATPGIEIDLNGIAPGHSVDRVSALLVALGEPNHLVEIGGEVRARGLNRDGRPFRVGIEEPDTVGRRVRLSVMLTNRALSTSGNYRNYVDLDGTRYVHTLDPLTGRPVRHRLVSVSVLHERCAMADAWATALLVVGPERAWALAQANGLDVLLMIAGPNGEVIERMTDGFSAIVERVPDSATKPRTH